MNDPVEPTSDAEGGAAGASPGPETPRPVVDHTVCLCAGLGPLLTQTLRTLTVPEEVRRTVHETEREALRLLKAIIDMRLSSLGGPGAASAEADRGTKLDVE